MTEKIRSAIADLKTRPWTAATYDMCQLDDGYDLFVRTAKDRIYEPSIVVTHARHFATLVPKGLHHSPVFVIWLPPQLEDVTYVLPYATPKAKAHTSTDLRKRELVVSWTCTGRSFIAKVNALKASIDRQLCDGAIPLIIASETHTAVSALLLGDDFLDELSSVGNQCTNYCPESEFTAEELASAMRRKRALHNLSDDCLLLESGDSTVLLRPRRAFRPNWIV